MANRRQPLIYACLVGAMMIAFGSVSDASHSWNGYHWARASNPFTLKLGNNVASVWSPFLVSTSTDWTKSTVLDTSIVNGGARPRNCRPTSGQVEVCSASYGSTGWLGVAQIWVSGSHITQGTVKVNDTYFDTTQYNTPAWRNLVMCQEVGHTFGLTHQDETFDNPNLGTCMDYTNDPSTNQHPNKHDYDQLVAIYTHLDSTTTVGQTPAGAAQNADDRASWGQLMRTNHNGKLSVFERDFGQGNKVVTFVIWE